MNCMTSRRRGKKKVAAHRSNGTRWQLKRVAESIFCNTTAAANNVFLLMAYITPEAV